MTRFALATVALTAVTLTASSAFAAPPAARQASQTVRIHHGVKSGSLTRGEAARLTAGQARIQRTKRRMIRNDGKLGPRERRKLNRMQNRQSRKIKRMKHNRRSRR